MQLILAVPSVLLGVRDQATVKKTVTPMSNRPLSDKALVGLIQNGDNDKFSELVLRYQDRIYTQCLRQFGQPELAQELTQDIFIKVFRNIQTFRQDSSFSTWIFRIAINHCINQRQRHYRRHHDAHEPLEGNNPDSPRQIRGSSDVLGDIQSIEWAEQIQSALDQLEPDQREILVLREIQELSYDEISQILDLPRGTVKSRMHRARTALAKLLSPYLSPSDLESK